MVLPGFVMACWPNGLVPFLGSNVLDFNKTVLSPHLKLVKCFRVVLIEIPTYDPEASALENDALRKEFKDLVCGFPS